jgi:hypothetical protein
MTVHHMPEAKQDPKSPHDREMRPAKCPHCKHDLDHGVDIAAWTNPPWITICAKCPFCDVGLNFFVMPLVESGGPNIQLPS